MQILLPTDFSFCARKAVEFCYNNFYTEHAEIQLVNCVRPLKSGLLLQRLEEIMLSEGNKELLNESNYIRSQYGQVPKTQVVKGYPEDLVKKINPQLEVVVVIGAKGTSHKDGNGLGAAAEAMVHGTKNPIFIIPENYMGRKVTNVAIVTDQANDKFIPALMALSILKCENPITTKLVLTHRKQEPVISSVERENMGCKIKEISWNREGFYTEIQEVLNENAIDLIMMNRNNSIVEEYLSNHNDFIDWKIPVCLLP